MRDLCVAYGKVEAVHQAALRVEEGRIVTVIGPNGAGKTTLLAALMGMLPARGSVCYAGKDINAGRAGTARRRAACAWCQNGANCLPR